MRGVKLDSEEVAQWPTCLIYVSCTMSTLFGELCGGNAANNSQKAGLSCGLSSLDEGGVGIRG